MTEYTPTGYIPPRVEIKNPLIVEIEHWNKLVEFVKDANYKSCYCIGSTCYTCTARGILKDIGEL